MFTKQKEEPERHKSVKREEWDTPSGAHAVSIELSVESAEAAKAIAVLMEHLKRFRGLKEVESINAHANWAGGYIAALVATGNIEPEQADELQKIADLMERQAIHNVGWDIREKSRGKRG